MIPTLKSRDGPLVGLGVGILFGAVTRLSAVVNNLEPSRNLDLGAIASTLATTAILYTVPKEKINKLVYYGGGIAVAAGFYVNTHYSIINTFDKYVGLIS
jgi:hypothetical protein|tara:strand:- start:2068 stop:2367 length:300 start_codon:yes stop_codon:yes gene_type:complete